MRRYTWEDLVGRCGAFGRNLNAGKRCYRPIRHRGKHGFY